VVDSLVGGNDTGTSAIFVECHQILIKLKLSKDWRSTCGIQIKHQFADCMFSSSANITALFNQPKAKSETLAVTGPPFAIGHVTAISRTAVATA
jgi:hypothetical protein